MKPEALTRWTPEKSEELYGINSWGSGYYRISSEGHVTVHPQSPDNGVSIDLFELVKNLETKNFYTPVLVRFANIIDSQIRHLNESFNKAIKTIEYEGAYKTAYPIKVNQKQQVVKDILDYGKAYNHGLEAGSKAELIAAIGSINNPDSFIICNGYKDEEFIDLALYSLKLGIQTIIVIEMPSELNIVLNRAREMDVKPLLGVRAKLSSRAGGRWDKSGGDRSKFGLNAAQVIELVDTLQQQEMLDCLKLLHYHLGSQVPDIRRIRTAIQEACRFYADLHNEGAPMGMLNIGGGLAVDYDGSQTNFASSRNYSMEEYAVDVIEAVMKTLDESGTPHPVIISESGRATVAHHSILLFNILHVRRFDPNDFPEHLPDDANETIQNLLEVHKTFTTRKAQEAYHDAVFYRDQVRSMFLQGNISLRERALAENMFWHLLRRIADCIQDQKYVPDELHNIEPAIADIYYGNFSLFQSIPDSWAIEQLFPVMPIHRLDEIPTRQAVIADITCDSDGKIDTFIDLRDVKHSLPLHELSDEEYYLGAFLTGAYQETLGDMHNLLGDTNIIHVQIDDSGKVNYIYETPGDSVRDVLTYVEYDTDALLESIYSRINTAAEKGLISAEEKKSISQFFSDGLDGYTYLEKTESEQSRET